MTKKAGEELCFACHRLYDLDVVALRFFTVYGPRNRPDMAIHKFAHLMMSGRSIPVFGTGRMERDWTYVEDAVEGCRAALDFLASRDSVYEIFNISSGRPVALETMIELLEEALGRQAERRPMPSQPGDVGATWGDIRKARERLGYSPRIPIETGMERFVAWFRREILALPLERRAVVQEA